MLCACIQILRPAVTGQTEEEFLANLQCDLAMDEVALKAKWQQTHAFLSGLVCSHCGQVGLYFEYGFWCDSCDKEQSADREAEIYVALKRKGFPLP